MLRIQKVIDFAAKLVSRCKKRDHVSDLQQRHCWISTADLGRFNTIALTHELICSGEPDSLACELWTVSDVHVLPTRQDSELFASVEDRDGQVPNFYS